MRMVFQNFTAHTIRLQASVAGGLWIVLENCKCVTAMSKGMLSNVDMLTVDSHARTTLTMPS